ncbi:AbrB/MazE/SpoVT family DNA-binding domain-containing protein [Rhizobium leguminosarum]|uniref:AbrB/MazE/SpoVT family DNA-binding domain-containing protein n=1 Tax=Rhizobium leguminosarum TaxID=384 RepID=UPI000FEC2F35|nr:hypothetical protein [Rhizobium leguminosarum]RWX36682.1 hypothetical protein EHI43_08725 [Rhizobium leguminosarum]
MTETKAATLHIHRTMDISTRRSAKGQSADGDYSTTSKLKKAGGSLVLTVPAAARDILGLTEGQEMLVSVRGGKVIAEPLCVASKPFKVRQPKYTLDELLEGYEFDVGLSAEERAWMYATPVGNEVW